LQIRLKRGVRGGERQGEDKVTLRISFYYYHDFTKDKALHWRHYVCRFLRALFIIKLWSQAGSPLSIIFFRFHSSRLYLWSHLLIWDVCLCVCVCIQMAHLGVVCICVCVYISLIWVYVCMCVCVCVYISLIWVYVCGYICIHILTYIYPCTGFVVWTLKVSD